MLLLSSSNCITACSPEACCHKAAAPPSRTILLASMLFTELWSHFCQGSVPASGLWKVQCPIWKFTGRNKLQSNTTAIMERGTGGFFFLPTQNSSGCCRANQALSDLELKYNSARNVLNLSFGKYTFMYWYVHKQQQHTDRTVHETHSVHTASAADILESSPGSLWTCRSTQQGQ